MRTILLIIVILTFVRCKTQSFILVDTNIKPGQIYTSYNVYYSLGGDSLLVESCKPTLDSLFMFLNSHKNFNIEIGNHTDFRGDDNSNLILSQNRAESLRKYFISKGIENKLVAKGYGETKPIRSKKEQDKLGSHSQNVNRRTTLKVFK